MSIGNILWWVSVSKVFYRVAAEPGKAAQGMWYLYLSVLICVFRYGCVVYGICTRHFLCTRVFGHTKRQILTWRGIALQLPSALLLVVLVL